MQLLLAAQHDLRHTAIKQEQDGIAPIQMLTVQLEQVFAFGHTLNHFRQVGNAAAAALREEGFVAMAADDLVDPLVELTLRIAEEGSGNVYFHR